MAWALQWISVTKVMTPGATTLLSLEGSEPQEWPRNTKKRRIINFCSNMLLISFGQSSSNLWILIIFWMLWLFQKFWPFNSGLGPSLRPGLGRCLVGPPLRHLLRALDRRQACADAATPAVAAEAAQHRTPLCGPGSSGDWRDVFFFKGGYLCIHHRVVHV